MELQDVDAGPADQSVGRLRFRYASGETDGPQHAVELVQGADAADEAASGVPLTELEAIVDRVEHHGSAKPSQEYRWAGNIHRDWNLARIAAIERRRLTLNIGGRPAGSGSCPPVGTGKGGAGPGFPLPAGMTRLSVENTLAWRPRDGQRISRLEFAIILNRVTEIGHHGEEKIFKWTSSGSGPGETSALAAQTANSSFILVSIWPGLSC